MDLVVKSFVFAQRCIELTNLDRLDEFENTKFPKLTVLRRIVFCRPNLENFSSGQYLWLEFLAHKGLDELRKSGQGLLYPEQFQLLLFFIAQMPVNF